MSTLPDGKCPPELLRELLADMPVESPELAVRPGVGVDAAGLELTRPSIAVATDPITFATDRLGTYAVSVNINDVACLGCRPRWFTADLLLPSRTDESTLRGLWYDLIDELRRYNLDGIGGHTEVTPAVKRPIVAGQMIGERVTDSFLQPSRARAGDRILVWRGAAPEGTALIARERRDELRHHLPSGLLERMTGLLDDPGICVWPFVRDLLPTEGLVCLHDPTEGGLATALHELADAAGLGLRLDEDRLPVLEETERLCGLLNIDPLGLLASGSLIVVVRPGVDDRLLESAGSRELHRVGVLTDESSRLLRSDGSTEELPRYPSDEIIRALQHPLDVES